MTPDQLRKNVLRSTASSWLRILLRMALGLVTFRLLYQGLAPEEFGFWALLWAIFGYGILLDFGLGSAAQKQVAELSVRQDWPALSRVLSTILGFHILSAAVVVTLGFAFSGPLVDLFQVSPANREPFRRIFTVFLTGMGIAFPLGIFIEVLYGQHRITTANNIAMASLLANFAAVVLSIVLHLGLLTLVTLAVLSILIPYAFAAFTAVRHMPQVRLLPSLFSLHTLATTARFSVCAYLNMLSSALRNKVDQPIIASILGIAAVTPYQAGSRVGEMFGMLTRQVADVLSPTAAHLHAKGDTNTLRQMLIDGLRLSILAATPLYLVTAFYMNGVLRFLTGVPNPSPEMVWTGQVLLFWYYSLTITHWVFKRMFLMAGQERRLMIHGVAEAALNIGLGITLTLALRNILGVAIGSAIPTVCLGWGLLWGWAAREARLTRWNLLRRVVLPAWYGCLPMIALALAFQTQPFWTSGANILLVVAEAAAVSVTGLAGLWFLALSPTERTTLSRRLRRQPAPPAPPPPTPSPNPSSA